MNRVPKSRRLSLVTCFVWLCLVGAGFGVSKRAMAQNANTCVDCHSGMGQVVAVYLTSTHARARVGCDACHGGNPRESGKAGAHSGRFVAIPDSSEILQMCGACHRQPVEFFVSSRHHVDRPNVKRLDCIECHGVHGIGAASESFRWPSFCAGCHGLEYLPPLPGPFQEMLTLADDLGDGLQRLQEKGSSRRLEFGARRREVRRLTSELVHRTDTKGAAERIPRILEMGAPLKREIAEEERKLR